MRIPKPIRGEGSSKFKSVTPSETVPESPESHLTTMELNETELTLALPGAEFRPKEGNNRSLQKSNAKRNFQETIELSVGSSTSDPLESLDNEKLISTGGAAVMGWPPVRSFRKKTIETNSDCKYVKVAVDGAPYLRKIDLEKFNSYPEFLRDLQKLFTGFPIFGEYLEKECNIFNPMNGGTDEYLPTYEDKDGDWMLVGDVPWKSFIESCKRIRLMKGSEAIGKA